MAYLHRLIALAFLALFASTSFAVVPPTGFTYSAGNPSDYWYASGPDPLAVCQSVVDKSIAYNTVNQPQSNPWRAGPVAYSPIGLLCTGDVFFGVAESRSPYSFNLQKNPVCPAGAVAAGQQCVCTGAEVNGQCVRPPCEAGQTSNSTEDSPWYKSGDLVSAYAFQTSVTNAPGCVARQGQGCSIRWGPPNADPRENKGSNGHSFWTVYLSGVTTGEVCAVVASPDRPPEPTCAGQSGLVNGVRVCLPPESAAQKQDRIDSAARAAAAAASQNATNQGANAARSAAAAAAAAAATRQCYQDPACTPAQATAAAQAAAAASMAATAAANTPPTAAAAAAAAASVQAQIEQRAESISSAANLNSAQTAATIEAARTAGMSAYNNAIAAGLSLDVAANAAKVAGQSATASSIYGATPQATAANAAAAAAAATGGDPNAVPGPPGAPAGSGPGKSETPVDDFCKRNPQAAMCKNQFDSTFVGACGAPPVCTGDAVMCAIAAATHKQECNWNPGASAESAVYDLAKSKTGDQTTSLPGNSTVAIGPTSFSQTELLGAASGMQDRNITVMGRAIVLPFSIINPWLGHLGMVLQAVTFLLCLRIVTRG